MKKLRAITKIGHRYKSSSAIVGARFWFELCKKLEKAEQFEEASS